MLGDILLPLGPVAQSVEQRIENPCVGGSIPPQATSFFHARIVGSVHAGYHGMAVASLTPLLLLIFYADISVATKVKKQVQNVHCKQLSSCPGAL